MLLATCSAIHEAQRYSSEQTCGQNWIEPHRSCDRTLMRQEANIRYWRSEAEKAIGAHDTCLLACVNDRVPNGCKDMLVVVKAGQFVRLSD